MVDGDDTLQFPPVGINERGVAFLLIKLLPFNRMHWLIISVNYETIQINAL